MLQSVLRTKQEHKPLGMVFRTLPSRYARLVRRDRNKFADYFAMACGAAGLVSWLLGASAIALGAIVTGVLVLLWATFWP
jgi:hypothetical protein